MSRDPIIGSGRKGFGFEQKGFQERNLQLLLETLSKKETQKSIEALSKILGIPIQIFRFDQYKNGPHQEIRGHRGDLSGGRQVPQGGERNPCG